jgi:hypothetical protein
MKASLHFVLSFALAGPLFLAGCGPPKPTQLRSDFADSALKVVRLIEKAHNHQLELGKDELPRYAVDRLRTYARDFDENFVVDNVHGLDVIVDAHAENEYYQCDAEINQVLRSHLMLPDAGSSISQLQIKGRDQTWTTELRLVLLKRSRTVASVVAMICGCPRGSPSKTTLPMTVCLPVRTVERLSPTGRLLKPAKHTLQRISCSEVPTI